MIFIIIILVLIIAGGLFLIFKIKMNNKTDKTREKFSVLKKEEVPAVRKEEEVINKGDIEILDLNDTSNNSIDQKADTLDLDDLFKTISLTKVEDEKDFDFTLQRSEKK